MMIFSKLTKERHSVIINIFHILEDLGGWLGRLSSRFYCFFMVAKSVPVHFYGNFNRFHVLSVAVSNPDLK
jgi:hypothetical protein